MEVLEMNQIISKNYTRISKIEARKRHMQGKIVLMIPSKLHPDNIYMAALKMNNQESFDIVLNAFEYYNCNRESGKYTSFYILSDNTKMGV